MLPQPLRTLLSSHPPTPIATRPPCCLPSGAYPFAASLRIKLMAVYLAEDINATTLQPLYGARIRGVVPDTGAGPEGEISPLQRLRRAWTHAACDPDGDGWISNPNPNPNPVPNSIQSIT